MPNTKSRLIAIASALIIGIVAVACGDSSTSGGVTASDFTLPVANRPTYVTLSDFQDNQNVVLVFYRGFF